MKYKTLTIQWILVQAILFVNYLFWHIPVLDMLFFSLYAVLNGLFLARYIKKILKWSSGWSLVFAYMNLLYWWGFVLAIFIDLYKLTDVFVVIAVGVVGVVAWFLGTRYGSPLYSFVEIQNCVRGWWKDNTETEGVHLNKYILLVFPLLMLVGWYLLLSARTGSYLVTPWQVIPKIYVYVFLLVTFVTVVLIFSKLKVGVILLIIVLHSFLLHAYLPAVYETGFGGDKWRHLASEAKLMQGEVYSPALFGEQVRYVSLGPIQLPEVLVAGNKTSYGNQWGITIALAKFLHLDIFWVDYWLGFLLWSIVVPLLLYKFGALFIGKARFRLLLAFLPSLFYTFQVFGSITIPVAFGHVFFFWVLYLWLIYLRDGSSRVRNFALALSALMYFGYILNFLLIWEVAAMVLVLRLVKQKTARRISVGILLIMYICLLPVLEMFMGYGGFDFYKFTARGIFEAFADAFGVISGLVSFIPRPIHIDQGNWLYNQTRLTQSSASLFSWGILPFRFTTLVWAFILLSIEKIRRLEKKRIAVFLGVGLLVIFLNYIISWYLMSGNHILARRLDMTIVWLLIVFLSMGIWYVLESGFSFLKTNHKRVGVCMLLAVIATSTYTSGPVLEVVTVDEVRAAAYVWEHIDKTDGRYCVIANTWPLLALETVSAREIIAGGFPVYLEYAQPERVKIFEGLIKWPEKRDYITDAFQVTGASECWYMLERRWVSDDVWSDTVQLVGLPDKVIGTVNMWYIK